MLTRSDEVKKYWDRFYEMERLGVEDIPSQFAAFVLSELSDTKSIIDVGCGNGRDSFFFSTHAHKVIGIDVSKTAIDFCNKKRDNIGAKNTEFYQIDLSVWGNCAAFFESLSCDLSGSLVYARFLLHAIDEESEKNFMRLATLIAQQGGAVAAEFRTHRDAQQNKETRTHYRRYINPLEFMEKVVSSGLRLLYFTEGFGFAKYKTDDAHVARFVFEASPENDRWVP